MANTTVAIMTTTTLPMWFKNHAGQMLFLNDSYKSTYLDEREIDAREYLGRNDFSVWPPEVAAQFRHHDRMVMRSGVDFDGIEKVEVAPGVIVKVRIVKMLHNGGVFGVAIPAGMEEHPDVMRLRKALEIRKLARRLDGLAALMSDGAMN